MNEKNFEKINIKTIISIQHYTPLRNFNQSEEIQIMGLNLPKKLSDKNFGKINIKIVIRIQECNPVPNFSLSGELQIFGPNLPKKCVTKILEK